MRYKVVITDSGFPDHQREEEVLNAIADIEKITWTSEEELVKNASAADVLLIQWAPVTRRVIEGLTNCKALVRYGIGVDNIDLQAAREKGIPVCNVPDYCVEEVADHTISMVLSSLRQIPETDRRIRQGEWKIVLPRPMAPFSELNFCLAGFGRIARAVAGRAQALGFRVKACDPFVDPTIILAAGVDPVLPNDLFSQADVLSLHLPLQPDTYHFINETSLKMMKKNALIVNTSRGGLLDTDALRKAVLEGRIWGAALDVLEEEPISGSHPLLAVPGIVLSSHVAWYSTRSIPQLQQKAAEEALRALKGESLQNLLR